MARVGIWLVRTGGGPGQPAGGASEVQTLPAGQQPPSAAWGGAVYLGADPTTAARWIPIAAKRLGVPNPQNVPSFSTSVGILSSILAGFGIGTIGGEIGAGVGGYNAITGPSETAPPETVKPNPDEQTPPGRTRPGGAAEPKPGAGNVPKFLSSDLQLQNPLDFLKWIAWLFHPLNWLRAVEFLTGFFILYTGFRYSTRGFRRARSQSMLGRMVSATPIGRVARIRKYSRGYSERRVARERVNVE